MVAAVLGFIIGMVLGSFSKAAADRLGKEKSILGRSYCLRCKKTLKWYDLFPILSYLSLKGKCRYCHERIPLGNFLTEVIFGAIAAGVFYLSLPTDLTSLLSWNWSVALLSLSLVFKLFIIVIATIIFWTDLETGYILDKITYPASVVAVLSLIIASSIKSISLYQGLQQSALGKYLLPPHTNYLWFHLQLIWQQALFAVAAGAGMALFFALLIVITRGRGMGWGDVKYVFFIGLALGFPNSLIAVFLAFLLGAVFSVVLILANKKHFGQTIPFGPFLSLGMIAVLFFTPQIINWLLSSLNLGY